MTIAATQHLMIVASGDAARRIQRAVLASGSMRPVSVHAQVQAALGCMADRGCDVVVLGAVDAAGLDAIGLLRRHAPDVAVLVVTAEDADETLRGLAIACGAHECVALYELRPDLLRLAMRHALALAGLERERRAHDAERHALFDLAPHPMWFFDVVTLRFLAVNRAAIRTYGYSESEFLAMSIADLRLPAESERLRTHVEAGLPESEPERDRARCRRKDGGEIEVEIVAQAAPFRGRNARLVQARDVTARSAARSARWKRASIVFAICSSTAPVTSASTISTAFCCRSIPRRRRHSVAASPTCSARHCATSSFRSGGS